MVQQGFERITRLFVEKVLEEMEKTLVLIHFSVVKKKKINIIFSKYWGSKVLSIRKENLKRNVFLIKAKRKKRNVYCLTVSVLSDTRELDFYF